MTRIGFPWLKHKRIVFGAKCSKQADFFISLRALRIDRRVARVK